MILAESPRRQRVTKLVTWGHWFAFFNIVLALVISSIFVFSSPAPNSILGNFYLLVNWLGHISFVTFIGFVLFILPLCYVMVNHTRIVRGVSATVAALGLAWLAFDALLYTRTGFHISWQSAELVRSEASNQITNFGWQQYVFILLLFVVWLGFQLVLSNSIWRRLERLNKVRIAVPVSSTLVFCFITSHAIHVWADAQLYQPIIKQDNMFPLSYPATAKTTLSRHGLLDIERYQTRKQLQFDADLHNIKYPLEPVYCSVDSTQTVQLIVQTDTSPIANLQSFDLRLVDNYFSTSTSTESLVSTVLYGVPEIYQSGLTNTKPVLLALPMGLGMNVELHTDDTTALGRFAQYQRKPSTNPGLHIAFLTAAAISNYLSEDNFVSDKIIIATNNSMQDSVAAGALYTNLDITSHIASAEDLAPTVLNLLGCSAPIKNYSTGQNLLEPSKDWLVSTSGDKIIVVHQQSIIEVSSNGSYRILDLASGESHDQRLNVDLLSRAIKHLTRFSARN